MKDKIQILRWQTILSDLEYTFCRKVTYEDSLVITVSDMGNNLYEIIFNHPVIYQVIDETYLTHYWNIKEKGIGNTFILENSNWSDKFVLINEHFPDIKHYVIGTEDDCIEILSESEPVIRQINMGA
jgi:hypothetical protein